MQLPVMPPVKPMLAKAVADVPDGEYLYEPKWDGFRRRWSSPVIVRGSRTFSGQR